MWTLNPINKLSSSLDNIWVNSWLIYVTHIMLALYIMWRGMKETPLIRRGAGAKTFFTEASCRQATYKCRLQNQFIQLKREATKINQIYLETYKKFLRAIDHMEFHPTLGGAKTGSTIRLKRQPRDKGQTIKASQYINQMEGLTKEDKLMLRQADELIETKFLNKTTKKRRNKRFGLAGWISFILVMIGGLILCPIIAYVLWRMYRVHSNVKRFKPVVKIFNDKKGDLFNISDLVSNRL